MKPICYTIILPYPTSICQVLFLFTTLPSPLSSSLICLSSPLSPSYNYLHNTPSHLYDTSSLQNIHHTPFLYISSQYPHYTISTPQKLRLYARESAIYTQTAGWGRAFFLPPGLAKNYFFKTLSTALAFHPSFCFSICLDKIISRLHF